MLKTYLRLWLVRLAWLVVAVVGLTLVIHLRTAYEYETVMTNIGGITRPMERPSFSWAVWREQVAAFPGNALTGQLEYRSQSGASVPLLPLLKEAWGHSLRLFLYASGIGMTLGIILGSLAALRRRLPNLIALSLSLFGLSIPDFLMVLLAQFATLWTYRNYNIRLWAILAEPGIKGGWTLPVLVLCLPAMGLAARLTTNAVEEIMQADYIRTARSKGLPEIRVIWGHAFRNAIPRIVASLPLILNTVLSSLVVVEWLTNWPGITRYLMGDLYRITKDTMRTTVSFWGGTTPEVVATSGALFAAWYLLLDGAAQTIRLMVNPRAKEEGR